MRSTRHVWLTRSAVTLAVTQGAAVKVRESCLDEIQSELAREEGVLVGPEGAAAFAGTKELIERGRIVDGQSVVVFQTGHPNNYI